MECGHSGRYRYDRGYDPDNTCEDDRAEDWGCSLCDLREYKSRLDGLEADGVERLLRDRLLMPIGAGREILEKVAELRNRFRPPCYFALERDPSEDAHGCFYVATKEFWDERGHLDDQHISADIRLPDDFNEVMESVFAFEGGTPEEGRKTLLVAGLTENEAMLP